MGRRRTTGPRGLPSLRANDRSHTGRGSICREDGELAGSHPRCATQGGAAPTAIRPTERGRMPRPRAGSLRASKPRFQSRRQTSLGRSVGTFRPSSADPCGGSVSPAGAPPRGLLPALRCGARRWPGAARDGGAPTRPGRRQEPPPRAGGGSSRPTGSDGSGWRANEEGVRPSSPGARAPPLRPCARHREDRRCGPRSGAFRESAKWSSAVRLRCHPADDREVLRLSLTPLS